MNAFSESIRVNRNVPCPQLRTSDGLISFSSLLETIPIDHLISTTDADAEEGRRNEAVGEEKEEEDEEK